MRKENALKTETGVIKKTYTAIEKHFMTSPCKYEINNTIYKKTKMT